MVRLWVAPSESMIWTGVEKADAAVAGAAEFRLAEMEMPAVASGVVVPVAGSEMLEMAALVLTTPLAAFQPCTIAPVAVTRVPLASNRKLSARVYICFAL